ncbi:MAG: hypothetical protein ACJAVS_002089 [Paracoccaceae bacterium]
MSSFANERAIDIRRRGVGPPLRLSAQAAEQGGAVSMRAAAPSPPDPVHRTAGSTP